MSREKSFGEHRAISAEIETYRQLLHEAILVLQHPIASIRPADKKGLPGGIIELSPDIPTLVVPDLHGRANFLRNVLQLEFQGKTVTELLALEKVHVVCLGDGIHVEYQSTSRWQLAFNEYRNDYTPSAAMDREMRDNLDTMSIIWETKIRYPNHFHFLKGNHENILNENINGNHSFAKFAMEGEMTKSYLLKFFDQDFLYLWDRFEKHLPVLARGKYFILSHAQPRATYTEEQIINYRTNPEVVEGLTWTPNGASRQGTVPQLANNLLGKTDQPIWWVSGHRPVKGLYRFVPEESFLQIHNPAKYILALFDTTAKFQPDTHIMELNNE